MSQTLYRKYRPATFAELVGQEHIKQVLLEEIKKEAVAHAYLFSGPRGTGKTTTARLLAKALNCQKRAESGEPCNQCHSCQEIAGARSQDVIEIDAASNRRIDEMRQLREEVKYLPARDQYKVYIVDEAHMLTPEAFNAFLKTLEEPPAHIVFVLATTEIAKIPETIFSRCQHFSFTKLPFALMLERLERLARAEKVVVDKNVLEEVVRKSGGALRDAESLLGQLLSISKDHIKIEDASLFLPKVGFARVFSWLAKLINKDGAGALQELADYESQGVNLEFFLSEALEFGRQLLVYKIIDETKGLEWYFSPDEIKSLTELGQSTDTNTVRAVVVNLLRANQDMRLSPELPILPLELAVVTICEGAGDALKKNNIQTPINNRQDSQIIKHQTPLKSEARGVINSSANISNHSLKDILSGWGEVLSRIKDKNHALNFILGVAEPMSVNGNTVEIGFKYRLQQEKVTEHKNREIIEAVLQEVYGSKYRIQASLKEDIKIKPKEQNHAQATFCRIIKKTDGKIDWQKSAEQIYNQWRAFY
ncbi:MAG: DNA polymerase III subunit gamma/tau, partial [Candidatus Komeilibacteria bacterium]|nr:DNA polymerase III subunit gamma/tau [Candidatus Komeilibacteria bacterium]